MASSGHLGGAHVNPAVTIGFWSLRRFPGRDVLPYIVAQCGGAVAAAALLGWLLGPVGNSGATVPALSLSRAFVIEMGYTGLLGFVIMGVATDERSPAAVAPFVIGATVFAGEAVITLQPYWYWANITYPTHGTPHDYDAKVPLIFFGSPFRPGRYERTVRVVDIAPTLAHALGVRPTEALDGRVLRQALR